MAGFDGKNTKSRAADGHPLKTAKSVPSESRARKIMICCCSSIQSFRLSNSKSARGRASKSPPLVHEAQGCGTCIAKQIKTRALRKRNGLIRYDP